MRPYRQVISPTSRDRRIVRAMPNEAEILKRAREALAQLRSMSQKERAELVADGTEQSLLDLIERLTPAGVDPDSNPPSLRTSRGPSRS